MRNIVKLPPFGQFGFKKIGLLEKCITNFDIDLYNIHFHKFVFQYTRIFDMTWTSIKVLFHDGSYVEL